MAFAFKVSLALLACACIAVQADVSHLGYSRYNGPRVSPLRLQRLESAPTPYPAAGYRPHREFNLPREQPLFPLNNQQGNGKPQVSSGSDVLSEPITPQRPQLVYGAPEPRFPQQTRPQNFNGFNNLAEPQAQPEFVEQADLAQGQNQNNGFNNNNDFPQTQPSSNNNGFNNLAEPQQPQQQGQGNNNNNNFNSGFNNLAEPQERPELTYGAPDFQEQQQTQSGSDVLSEPQQRPQYNYNAPSAKLRQLLVARLQQAQRLEQQLEQQQKQADRQAYRYSQAQQQSQAQAQRLTNQPQTLYSAPPQRQQQTQTQSQSQTQSSRLTAQKPARLTSNREETEEEDAKTSETVVDIET